MNSGSWSSYQAALPPEARCGGEPDDDPPDSGDPWERTAARAAEYAAWRESMLSFHVQPGGEVIERDRTLPSMMGGRSRGGFVAAWWLVAVDPGARTAAVVRPGARRTIALKSKAQVRAALEAVRCRREQYAVWTGRASWSGCPGGGYTPHFVGPAPDPEPGDELGLR
jgi:hypothetical protein